MNFDRGDLSDQLLLEIYQELLAPRLIEEKMLVKLRQGKITKWFSGYGQEAISIGAAMALKADDFILPMHRNLGVFTARGVALDRLFAQFQGKVMGFTKGRDRSFHFGSKEHHLVGMISHLGAQLGVADGIALAGKMREENKVVLAVSGDGGASEGDFHEALNLAAVWDLPVIFLIENNQWGLSTPSVEQFRCKSFKDKGAGYGIDAYQTDGNNVLEVFRLVSACADDIRSKPRPIIIECLTFRIRGHEEASGTSYYPEGLIAEWSTKDPVDNFESFLLYEGILDQARIDHIKQSINVRIDTGLMQADAFDRPVAHTGHELEDVYAPSSEALVAPGNSNKDLRFIDAISEALRQSLDRYENLIVMGQDIAEYGGVFKVTQGMVDKYGKGRIRNTPISESAVLGCALGLSVAGVKSVVEMQFADFVSCGFNQIVNNLATAHYRWQQNADVVVRLPCGGGVGAGPFHSQSPEAWFNHVPGLKIVYPSSPSQAKGLLSAAIDDPNPVLFFEHKALYRSISQPVSTNRYTIEIGKAELCKSGETLSIITYGMGVHWARELANELVDLDIEILDLVSIKPWDKEAVTKTVKHTGKVLVLHEANQTGGFGQEISAWIAEHLFEHLDAPVITLGGLDTPIPFARELEGNYMAKSRLREKLLELHNY